MSFTTNGWDYVYHANIEHLNSLILTEGITELPSLIAGAIVGDITALSISGLKVHKTSHYTKNYIKTGTGTQEKNHKPDLKLIMTLNGTYDGNAFSGAEVTCSIDIDWINLSVNLKLESLIYNKAERAFYAYEESTSKGGLSTADFKKFIKVLYTNINNHISTISYDAYHSFFTKLNKFGNTNNEWMVPKYQVFSVAKDLHKIDSEKNCIFSFSCMISGEVENGNEKVRTNNNIGYVDLNAIPEGATSALVIERSVFGKHLILPKLRDNVFSLDGINVEAGKSLFDDTVSYTFRFPNLNEKTKPDTEIPKLSLMAKDYKGVYRAWRTNDAADDTQESGNVKEAIIRIEENLIRVILPKVTYHTSETGWKLWTAQQEIDAYQEYEIFLNDYKERVMDTQVITKRFELKNEYKQAGLSKFLSLGGLQGFMTLITALKGIKKDDNRNFIKVVDTSDDNKDSDIDLNTSTVAFNNVNSESRSSPRHDPNKHVEVEPRKTAKVYKKLSWKDKNNNGTELQSVSEISKKNHKIDYWDLLIKTTLINARNALKPSKFESELIDCIKADKMLLIQTLYDEYLDSFHKITEHFQSNPAIYLSANTIKKFKNYYNENKCEFLPHKIEDKKTRKEFKDIVF